MTKLTHKRFGMNWIGNVADEKEFRRKMAKRGYHVVETRINGSEITAWCIYLRNLSPELRKFAKTINKGPVFGETIHIAELTKGPSK